MTVLMGTQRTNVPEYAVAKQGTSLCVPHIHVWGPEYLLPFMILRSLPPSASLVSMHRDETDATYTVSLHVPLAQVRDVVWVTEEELRQGLAWFDTPVVAFNEDTVVWPLPSVPSRCMYVGAGPRGTEGLLGGSPLKISRQRKVVSNDHAAKQYAKRCCVAAPKKMWAQMFGDGLYAGTFVKAKRHATSSIVRIAIRSDARTTVHQGRRACRCDQCKPDKGMRNKVDHLGVWARTTDVLVIPPSHVSRLGEIVVAPSSLRAVTYLCLRDSHDRVVPIHIKH